jgi:serine/threonine protein kinase
VFGRYTLEAVAGRGGMGVVWRARDEELGETVALKFLPEFVASDAVAVDELKEETRRARRLTHPHIVRIHDFLRNDTTAAVSMEFVDGTTLAQLRLAQPGKVFAVEALGPLVAQLCSALDYAHTQAKVVHRDLKPANLLVTRDGQLKVTDFGIARTLTETATRLTGTVTGTSGTLLYMSPQQLTGVNATPADDIYAVGATLYDLLTGKPPFYTGDVTLQILNKIPAGVTAQRTERGHAAAAIPRQWEKTILQCLEKDAARRPKHAREIASLLGLAGGPTLPTTAGSASTPKPAASLHYSTAEKKPADPVKPASSSIHYPHPDRKKKSGPLVWVDLLVIAGLLAAGLTYALGLTPLPRPWIKESPVVAPASTESSGPGLPAGGAASTDSETKAAGPAPNSTRPATPSLPEPAGAPAQEGATAATTLSALTTPAAPAVPQIGTVRLAMLPENVRATLDDSPVSLPTPLNLTQLPPGHHSLTLRAAGYREKLLEFTVEAGQILDLGTARLEAGTGGLVIDSQPTFVEFELTDETGRKYRGFTPWDDKLPVGAYTLTFIRSGFANTVKKITLEDKQQLKVMADFSGGSAIVSLRGNTETQPKPSPPDAPTSLP